MKIGIVGGYVAFGAARFWTNKDVSCFSARASAPALIPASKIGTPAEAVAFREGIMLAAPWTAVPDALRQGGDLRGKIVMSTVNALKPDMSGLVVGTTTSAMDLKPCPMRSGRQRHSLVRQASCRRFDGSHRTDKACFSPAATMPVRSARKVAQYKTIWANVA